MLFSVMALGMFMALLDIQIVASSISEIQAGLAAAPDESSWIQTAYLMAEIVMIPLAGWLSRAFSTRWLFTVSAAGFTLASLACGMAWNIESMIVARAFQGFLGGAMIPTAFATGFFLFRGKKQAVIPATLGILGSLAPSIGPSLGGWITNTLSWHWIFFLNLLPGLAITLIMPRFEPIDEPDPSLLKKFDWIGLVLLAVFLACLQYVLEEGYRWNWFEDGVILTMSWISGAAGVLFIHRSLTYASPIVDLRALQYRTFAVASLFRCLTGFGMFASIYALPLYLARVQGLDALQIGAAVFVAGLSQIAGAPLAALLSSRIDMRWMMAFGLGMFALGLWMSVPMTSQWTGENFLWAQAVRGFSILFCIVPATNMALGSLPPSRLKMGSSLFNTMTNLGGAVGIASVNTLLNSRTNFHWHHLAESLRAGDPKVQAWLQNAGAQIAGWLPDASMLDTRTLAVLARTVRKEALTLAFADVFWMMSVLFFAALALVPLLKRPNELAGPAGEAAH